MITERLLTTADTREWQSILPARTSVFGSVEYARIIETYAGYQARLYVLDTNDERVVYPFFLRPVRALPFAQGLQDEWWDSLTPEYTGPIVIGRRLTSPAGFLPMWLEACRSLGIVAEFAHLHPWDACLDCLDPDGVAFDREIVYVDLKMPLETMVQESFSYACRKNLRRAQSEGIEVQPAATIAEIEEFHRIYSMTMDRNNALAKYYFPFEYFLAFFREMPDNACFMLARHQGRAIAGALYLHDDHYVYSYLGGAHHEYQQMRPTNAVIFEAIRWAQEKGKQRLILGGGYQPEDGIFRFKASFSSLRARFSVYRKIQAHAVYASLTDAWAARSGRDPAHTDYFPAYRTPLSAAST